MSEIDTIQEIVILARKLAETEPFRSANGPDALRAFATRLEAMATIPPPSKLPVVNVAVRLRRKKTG
jgi:hypothetical protein